MPDDWKYIQLDEVADFVGGYSYKGNELQPSKYAMATIKNFERKGGFKLEGYKEIIPSDKCKIEQEAKLYDILVAHTDLTQNADVIGNAELLLCIDKYEKIVFSMDVVKVVPKNNMPHFILATMLKSKEFKNHCLGYVNGTTVLHLSKKALPDYIINIPNDMGILSKLEDYLKNIYTLISNNLNENIKLTHLRDTLLPKLMSGEIDVSNVDISTDKLYEPACESKLSAEPYNSSGSFASASKNLPSEQSSYADKLSFSEGVCLIIFILKMILKTVYLYMRLLTDILNLLDNILSIY